MSGPATSSKAALLHDLEKKRQEREKLRQSNAKEAAEETHKHSAALRIQSFVRSVLARSRWAELEWKSIQKQVQDLQTLAKIVQMKGQPFLAPGKVLLTLMRRSHWQVSKHLALRSADLAEVLCALSGFVLDALRVSHRDVHRSICYLMTDGMEKSAHAPAAAWTLYRFCAALLQLATTGRGEAPAAKSLAQLLDVAAWGDGSAQDMPAISAFASFLLQRLADPQRLHSWRVCASGCAWGRGDAPEKLQQLVAVQVALLRLGFLSQDRGNAVRGVVAAALQAALAVPRAAGPLGRQFAVLPRKEKVAEDLVWSDVLAQLPQKYQESGQHRQGSAKALEQEYAMAYAAGNLLELHAELQLPLAALLPLLALLVERAVEVSMLPGSASSGDEPVALQELRRQLKAMAEPAAVVRMWSDILCLRFRPKENLAVPLRGYQRHCLAVVSHKVCPKAVSSLAQLYSVLLSKARAAAKAGSNHQVFQGIANAIAYMEGGDVPKALWRHIESVITDMDPSQLKAEELHLLHLQALLVSQTLGVLSSEELQGATAPLCRHDMPSYVAKVSALASTIAWTSSGSQIREELLETAGRVLAQLYRICDRKWVPVQNWHAPEPILDGFKAAMKELTEHIQLRSPEPRTLPLTAERLLRHVPQAIPFEQRVALLRARVQVAKEAGLSRPVVKLTVRRSHLFEDGLISLMAKDADWRARFQVVFVNSTGRPEQGQDAGGLFKEFWEKLAETAFNPEYGLFRVTEERLLFPNPEAWKYHENVETLLEFLGLVIGKAIFEGIVVEPCFATFFLAKLLGKHNFYYDLQSLDPALFANLQQLKNYSGDVSDLCLNFVVTSEGKEVPLLPNGQDVPVTAENRVRYIYLLSDFKLNKELHRASSAFLAGFRRLIDEKWLRILSEGELQQVISGSTGGTLDVDDLQRHTEVSNCSGPRDRLVKDFFTALRAMEPQQQVKVLRFVTSCSRAPLLGFSHLQPPFTIYKVHIRNDSEKLPTASTCFNTLKLPTYSSWKIMKQKLEFVIVQDAGFELD